MKRRDRANKGFTIIELLVVLAIIGMLLGLLLPAVLSARENARRSNCGNNLKQLGLALHLYEQSFGALPSTVRVAGPGSEPRLSWETLVLPYLEQQALYDRIDQTQPWSSGTAGPGFQMSNREVAAVHLQTFECPTTPNHARLDGDPHLSGGAPWQADLAAPMDYSAITHVEVRLQQAGLVDKAGKGAMPKDTKARWSEIKDGMSNTILLAESAGRPLLFRKRSQISELPTEHRVNGGGWTRPASDFALDGSSADGTSFPGPCALNCTNGEDVAAWSYPYPSPYGVDGTGEVYAFHPGGANILLCDGAVRFMQERVDIRVVAAFVTRDRAEVAKLEDLER